MAYILGVQSVLFLVVLYVVYRMAREDRDSIIKAVEREREGWIAERRELLNRITHPERMPTKTSGASTVHSNLSPETRKALHSVGKVAPQMSTDGD